MRHKIILIPIICISVSCGTYKPIVLPQNDDIRLTISTHQNTVNDTVTIYISLENNTHNDLYLLNLNRKFLSISNPKTTMWNLEIFFQDTIRMKEEMRMLINYGTRSRKDDYILLKSGEKYTFHIKVDFSTLVRSSGYMSGVLNTDYGGYSMRLVYKDLYYSIKAFRGRIESNVIGVLYRE